MNNGTNLTGGDCCWVKKDPVTGATVKDANGIPVDNYPRATGPVSGTHYLFVSTAEIDRLIAAGATRFRLVFAWECLQPKPWQTLSSLTGNYKTYWDGLKARIDYITGKGCLCVIDIHGGADSTFGAYRDVKIGSKLGTGEDVSTMFENLYWELGKVFAGNPRVEWGLTNEPVGMSAAVWFAAAQRAITKLRSVGANQQIWCPGIAFTGAGTWVTSGNAAAWNLTDPAGKLGVQVHMYLDTNSGGFGTDIVNEDIGVTRLKPVIDWARGKGLKVLLAEVGISAADPIASKTWARLTTYMATIADVLAGWLNWATGPLTWWGNYQFCLCDSNTGRANLALVGPALKGTVTPTGPTDAERIAALTAANIALKADVTTLSATVDSLRIERDAAVHTSTAFELRAGQLLEAVTNMETIARGVL